MDAEQVVHLLLQHFEISPVPSADGASWLPVNDPIVLASFEQQMAIEHFGFGVQRSPSSGQLLVMAVCFERYRHAIS